MIVRTWMTKEPAVVPPGMPLLEAHERLRTRRIRRLPVVEGGRVVGIVTLTDMQRLLFAGKDGEALALPEHFTVRDVMTKNPLTATPGDAIEDAALCMHKNRVRSLPVLENGALVGILTESDLIRALLAVLGAEQPGRRVAIDLDRGSSLQSLLDQVDMHDLELTNLTTFRGHSQTHDLVLLRVRGTEADEFVDAIGGGGSRILDVT
ncbi:MAG: HPP family protein [Planctomycetota bacterium JB042]